MSLKNYFKTKSVQGLISIADANEDVESTEYIEQYIKDKYKYENVLDFSTASNFAVFGSAREYYDFSIESIQNNYPYDGSATEKLEWANLSNPLDLYIFDKEYPRTNGHVIFNLGTVSVRSNSGSVNNHSNPTKKEYIYFVGGPNVNNLWDTGSYRGSNLEINGNKGNTVEFWLKKEGFSTTNRREVLLDVWSSGSLQDHHQYGRFTLELDQQRYAANQSPFVLTYKSGSSGVHQAKIGAPQLAVSASDNLWHHYAITIQNTGSNLSIKTFVDGKLNHSTMTGSIVGETHRRLVGVLGALSTAKAGLGQSEDPPYNTPGNSNLGWGKLSGSIDEFRYWKTMRSEKDISRNYFTQVNGGSNTDKPNTKLGVYFKFNEGIARTDTIGKIILDYAGRLSNGTFVNYTSSNRSVESAMVQSGKAKKEFKDPIIHTDNARLINFKTSKKNQGLERDLFNSSALINSVPAWILDEDEEDGGRGNTRKLLQIIGSYFDVLYAQTTKVAQLKHSTYSDYDEKPFPFMQQLLSSYGLDVDTMFLDASVLETFRDRTEKIEFENKLHDVKNMIYRNLYNCLVHINKAKGTEKAIRNVLRTHGIDEELVELKAYSDGATYEIRPNYRVNVHKTNAINFHRTDNQRGSIFQYSSSFGLGSKSSEFPVRGYITGSQETISTEGLSFTTEAEVYFPVIFDPTDDNKFVETPLTSSIFGTHTVIQTPSGDNLNWTTAAKDLANFNVLVSKESINSKNARFQLTSRSGKITSQQSKVFRDVYSGKKWNLAFRLKPTGSMFSNTVSGSTDKYVAELFGVNVEAGVVQDKFLITQVLNKQDGEHFHKFSKRIFAGAERNNTAGAVVKPSDVHISYLRHWVNYLDDDTIIQHATDAKNVGIKNATKRAFSTHQSIDNDILNMDTLALNWTFETVTGSSAGGNFVILDASSGSAKKVSQFGQLGQILGYNHPGRAVGFPASTTASVITQYFPTYRETGFENIKSSDMIQVLSQDEQTYTKESRPIDYMFIFEKSMYKVISQEMIDMFSTIEEYSNLIGDPINRYRPNYKAMEKVRSKFFEGVENVPSFERFMEFYRWIDSSLASILDQFMPASAKRLEGIKNIVESHDLERNKYWTKFPTLEKKQANPSANILGVNELLYDWEHGHAPLPSSGVAATATITTTGAPANNQTFTLTDATGLAVTYVFKTGVTTVDGTKDGANVIIGVNGAVGSAAAVGDRIRAAIGASDIKMSVTETGSGAMSLKQLAIGKAGNTQINMAGVSTTTSTNFSGGKDIQADDNVNCLWQKERATRTKDRKVSSAVDSSRETIRRVGNTDVSGSTYAIRKLTRPYKLSAGFQHVLHGGDNFHLNKKKDFFKSTTNPGSEDFISVTASNINVDTCPDVHVPRYRLEGGQVFEKKRYGGEANISDTNKDHDINTVLPFSLYTSSISNPVGYQKFIADEFKKGVDITNLHNDSYGDDREIPVQGPFHQQHVGGHFHRHLATNRGENLDQRGDRREAFFISASNGQLLVLNPDMEGRLGPEKFNVTFTGSYAGRVNFMREPIAKRPINIRNIKTTTGSAHLGNYQHDYQVVLGTSVEMSKDHLIENIDKKYSVDVFHSQSSDKGGYTTTQFDVDSEFSSSYFYGYKDRVRPDREVKKHVITSRFSAPGGPETAGTAHGGPHIDVATNQLSVYNNLNYRNLTPRLMLDKFSGEKQELYGHRAGSSITAVSPTASFHSVNRNHRYDHVNHKEQNAKFEFNNYAVTSSTYFFGAGNGMQWHVADHPSLNLNDSEFTITFWQNFSGSGANSYPLLKSNQYYFQNTSGATFRFVVYDEDGHTISVDRYANGGGNFTGSAAWYHVAVTYDGSRRSSGLNIYVNAVSESQASGRLVYDPLNGSANVFDDLGDSTNVLRLGYGSNKMVDPVFFNKKLTQQEIAYQYNSGTVADIRDPRYFGSNRTGSIVNYWKCSHMPSGSTSIQNLMVGDTAAKSVTSGVGTHVTVTDHSLQSSDDEVLNVQLSTRKRIYPNVSELATFADNQFVQHQIPQSDLGYAWIKNSTIETSASFTGYTSRFTHPVGLSNQTSSSPLFNSASAIGSARFRNPSGTPFQGAQANMEGYYPLVDKVFAQGSGKFNTNGIDKIHVEDFEAFDFVGLNTFLAENINTQKNLQGRPDDELALHLNDGGEGVGIDYYSSSYINSELVGPIGGQSLQYNNFAGFSYPNSGGLDRELDFSRPGNKHSYALLLNALNANRGNSFGFNPWNQLRAGQKPIARALRKQNVFSFVASKIELPIGTNEDANPDQFRFRAPAPFVDSLYSWPDNINFAKRKRARTAESPLTQFTESAATSNNLPIRFENYYIKAPDGSFNKLSAAGLAKPNILQTVSVTYDNAFSNFSNDDMRDFLRLTDFNPPGFIERFAGNLSIADANRVKVGRTIFPREENVFTQKARSRTEFSSDWARSERSDRRTENLAGALGNNYVSASSWLLDGYINFPTTAPHGLGSNQRLDSRVGGEGELMMSTGIYRSGVGGRGAVGYPKAAPVYARKFAETPQIYKIHIKQDGFSHTAFNPTGSQREATFYIGNPRTENRGTYLITLVGPNHPDTATRHPDFTLAYVKLSASATTTRAAVDQIVDGLNSFAGNDEFSKSSIVFKDVARAKASADKRTIIIEMFQAYENSSQPYDSNFGKYFSSTSPLTVTNEGLGANGMLSYSLSPRGQQFGMVHFMLASGSGNSIYDPGQTMMNMPTTLGANSADSAFNPGGSNTPLEDRKPVTAVLFSGSISKMTYLAGSAKYEVGSPWEAAGEEFHGPNKSIKNYDSYDDWSEQLRKFKDYSVVPEYRISEEMSAYIGVNSDDPFFECPQQDFLSLTGSNSNFNNSSKDDFYEILSHSDFMKNFNTTFSQLRNIDSRTNPDEISLTCNAVKKLLPYEGFYPSQRINQLSKLFNQDYGPQSPHVGENYRGPSTVANFRNMAAPFFAPGIAFNSVKSGIAVDYPLFVPMNDRPFIGFATGFAQNDDNRVNIGRGIDWEHLLTGSAATNANGSISVAAWIYPTDLDGNSTNGSSIISFGGQSGTAPGYRLFMPSDSGSLRLSLVDTNGDSVVFINPTGSGTIKENSWNFVGATIVPNSTAASGSVMFHINGVTRTGSVSGGNTANVNRQQLRIRGNCMIGNSAEGTSTRSFRGKIADVCVFNRILDKQDFDGLYGDGAKVRGPWRPDMCVRTNRVESIVGWYRMGNDTGQVTLSASSPQSDANLTNRLRMDNKAWKQYTVKHAKRLLGNKPFIFTQSGDGTVRGSVNVGGLAHTGSEYTTNEIASSGFPYSSLNRNMRLHGGDGIGYAASNGYAFSLVTASFDGFTQSTSVGIIPETSLTGAFQYPSYITGSGFNETADGGIPRIGSASWGRNRGRDTGNHGGSIDSSGNPRETVTDWQQGGKKYGIQRVERVPFEAIVDPRLLAGNSLRDTGNGLEERFVVFDTEPHPSASLQPCSYSKFLDKDRQIGRRYFFDLDTISVDDLTASRVSVLFTHTNTNPSWVAKTYNFTSNRFAVIFASNSSILSFDKPGANTVIVGDALNPTPISKFVDDTIAVLKHNVGDFYEFVKDSDRSFIVYPLIKMKSTTSTPVPAFIDSTNPIGSKAKVQDIFPKNVSVPASDIGFNSLPSMVVMGQPVTSSALTSSFNLTSVKAIGETTYINAANNFYAESMNFFLQDGNSTVLASDDVPQLTVDYGKTYKMKIRLSRVNGGKDFPIYSLPQTFGPAVDAGTHKPGLDNGDRSFLKTDTFAHGYSGYTPPHYDKFAEVEYTFTPDENEAYDLSNPGAIETIVNRITIDNKTSSTIKFNRFLKATGSLISEYDKQVSWLTGDSYQEVVVSGFTDSSFNTAGTVAVTSSLNKSSAMQLSASFRGLGLGDTSLINVFRGDEGTQDVMRKQLVIQSKWECPNLNFSNASPKQASIAGISVPKGLWHQKGEDAEVARVEILPPDRANVGDLGQLLGMHFESGGRKLAGRTKTIGLTSDTKVISEAVIAVPFRTLDTGEKQFFPFSDEAIRRIYQQTKMYPGHGKYKSNDTSLGSVEKLLQDKQDSTNLTLQPLPSIAEETFVDNMVKAMIEHILPPKMNFLKYSNPDSGKYIKPFLMYVFPFEHTLNKQDLQNIWQNLPPDIAKETYNRPGDGLESSVTVKHPVLGSPLEYALQNGKMESIRWMIFKVKKAAQKNYFRKLDRDRLPINHPNRSLEENEMFEAGFNWPYDYFSLVELIKVKADVSFAKFDRTPRPLSDPPSREGALEILGVAPKPANRGPTANSNPDLLRSLFARDTAARGRNL